MMAESQTGERGGDTDATDTTARPTDWRNSYQVHNIIYWAITALADTCHASCIERVMLHIKCTLSSIIIGD